MSKTPARIIVDLALTIFLGLAFVTGALAQSATPLAPGSIQVSRLQYDGNNGNAYTSPFSFPEIFNDQAGCTGTTNNICNIAGIQSSIYIDQFSSVPATPAAGSLSLPSTGSPAPYPTQEPGLYITSSFSSKSEGALMLSPNGNYLTYMGYQGSDQLDNVSNSYSPNPNYQLVPNTYTNGSGVPYPFYDREVALIGASGLLSLTPIDNAFSGDNPRAAITVDGNEFYMGGNSDSTEYGKTTLTGPGLTIGARCGTPLSSLSYQLGTYTASDRTDESAKKHIKDNNWRGLGIFNDASGNPQLYVAKGSGGNGDDGVFQVGSSLPACTVGGTDTNATITPLFSAPATNPNNSNLLSPYVPFGFYFANPTTLYVADEGYQNFDANGNFIPDTLAGLEKWSLVSGVWTLDYTIQAGLNMYQPTSPAGYLDSNGNQILSYVTGLRNLAGSNNGDGTVTLYAITGQYSSVSGGEPDPTSLVGITDSISATTLPTNEQFVFLQTSGYQEVFRGVAYVPTTAARASQSIAFTSPGTATYGASPIALAATATSGWPISYSLVSGPATLSGNLLTLTGAGSVVVSASQSGNTDFTAASASQTITVNPAVLTVAASNASFTYGGSLPSLAYNVTGFVNGDSSSVVTGAPVVSTAATSSSPAGTYAIAAALGTLAATNYTFSFVPGTLTINPAPLNVSANNASSVYGSALPTFTASYSGFVNGDSASSLTGSPALTTAASSASPVGTYTITAAQGSLTSNNYTFAFSNGSLNITAAQLLVTANNASFTYGGTLPTLAATITGFVNGDSSTVVSGAPSLTTTATSGSAAGTYPITASQGSLAAANYTFTFAGGTLTINKATPSLAWSAPAPITYGTALSGTQLNATSSVAGTFSYSPSSGTVLNAGSQLLSASFTPNDTNDYLSGGSVSTTVVVNPAATSVTWTTPAAITYGTALSGTQLDATATQPGTFLYTPALGTILNAGSNTLSVSFTPNSSNYAPSSGSVTLVVNKAAQSITVTTAAPATEVYNGSFTVAGTASSGLPLTYTASSICTVSGATYTMTAGTGTCSVKFTQAGNGNYNAASTITQSTVATEATQTVSLTGPPASAGYGTTFTVVPTTNAPITPLMTVSGPCSISGYAVTINASTGTCKVTATWNGNGNYILATASESTTATLGTPVVTWAAPAAITYGTPLSSTQLDATANLGGTFTYTPASGKIESAGTVTLSVTFKPTNHSYSNLTTTVPLTVNLAATTTSITSGSVTITRGHNGLADTTMTANVTSYKPTGHLTLTAATGETCTMTVSSTSGNGSCKLQFSTSGTRTITAAYGGDANHSASDSDSQTPPVTVTVN